MTFKTSLVDIDKITSKVARSHFSETHLEQLAHLILELNGIVQPLIVQEIGLEKYEVIEGDFQFYGALKAWEIDDDFEMIRAFIVNKKENNLVSQQLNLLQSLNEQNNSSDKILSSFTQPQEQRIDNLEQRLNNFIVQSEAQLQDKIRGVEAKINQLSDALPSKLDTLRVFNELEASKLIIRLEIIGISATESHKIVNLITKERQNKPFTSLVELLERSKINQGKKKVRLITEQKLIKIIDRWSQIAFY